jgi:DNA-binding PucR family transcriptional regulator
VYLRNLLDLPELRLALLTGEDGLDRPIRWVVTTDMPDPSRYLAGDELVLTGMMWRRAPADSESFVAALAAAGVSGLAAGDAALGTVPADVVDACRRHRVPLFEVPIDVAFATVTEAIVRRLSAQRAGDMVTILDRHRRLLTAGSDSGDGVGAVLELVSRDLGLECWVLSPTGRLVAGAATLAPALELRLAREFLDAARLPRLVTFSDGQLFTVYETAGSTTPHRIASWCVAVESDTARLPAERQRLVEELVALVGAERERLARQRRHPLAAELIELLLSGAEAPEFLPQLRACGLAPDGSYLALVAATPGRGALAVAVLEEVVLPVAPGAVLAPAGSSPAGHVDAAAVVPVAAERVARLVEEVRTAVHALEPGLDGVRIHIGVSGAVAGARGLRGAAEAARYACRLAALRPGRTAVVGDDELSSHLLLLAGVPDDLRRLFRDRVLGPLGEYDREHGSDLIPTLRTFLECSGSWTRCAEILHVHVNTLRYRIQRIEQLTGRDLGSLPDRVDLFLALQLH